MADPMDEMFNSTPKVNDDAKEEYDYLYEDPLPIGEEQAPSNNTETSPTTNSSKEDKSFIQGVG